MRSRKTVSMKLPTAWTAEAGKEVNRNKTARPRFKTQWLQRIVTRRD